MKEIVRTGKVVGSVTRCLTDLFSLFTIFIITISKLISRNETTNLLFNVGLGELYMYTIYKSKIWRVLRG